MWIICFTFSGKGSGGWGWYKTHLRLTFSPALLLLCGLGVLFMSAGLAFPENCIRDKTVSSLLFSVWAIFSTRTQTETHRFDEAHFIALSGSFLGLGKAER